MTRASTCRLALLSATAAVCWAAAGLPAAIGFGRPAEAAQHPPSSLYTSIGLDTCKPARQPDDKHSWLCAALMPVYAAERDGRFYLAIGANAQSHRAAQQSLPGANSPLDPKSLRITIEWRVKTRATGPAPYASIIRFFTHAPGVHGADKTAGDKAGSGQAGSDGKMGEVLVVTKIGTGQSCHMAYVDALANSDAIVLARAFADEKTAGFDCAAGAPVWLGTRSKP